VTAPGNCRPESDGLDDKAVILGPATGYPGARRALTKADTESENFFISDQQTWVVRVAASDETF